ncbi:hypothetical protein [Ammoniphilus sp. 3BR4]|uniref:hypothetical protein n=1 Tax=Ammoniphilus sp. 3BR4 TaxID=3158265 RepID=UPI003467C96A
MNNKQVNHFALVQEPQNGDEFRDCFVALDITLSDKDKQWVNQEEKKQIEVHS